MNFVRVFCIISIRLRMKHPHWEKDRITVTDSGGLLIEEHADPNRGAALGMLLFFLIGSIGVGVVALSGVTGSKTENSIAISFAIMMLCYSYECFRVLSLKAQMRRMFFVSTKGISVEYYSSNDSKPGMPTEDGFSQCYGTGQCHVWRTCRLAKSSSHVKASANITEQVAKDNDVELLAIYLPDATSLALAIRIGLFDHSHSEYEPLLLELRSSASTFWRSEQSIKRDEAILSSMISKNQLIDVPLEE